MTRVRSLTEARLRKAQKTPNAAFQEAFRSALRLRDFGPTARESGMLCLTWPEFSTWFHKEIADLVFKYQAFERDTLLSITYATNILVSYARTTERSPEIAMHVMRYGESNNPKHVLQAAESAFLMYVLWPEERLRRSVHYRNMAVDVGPFLFSVYTNMTRRPFGKTMSGAFQTLGTFAREIIYRT